MEFTPLEYLTALENGTLAHHPAMRALSLDDPEQRPPGSLGAQAWIWAGMTRYQGEGDEDDLDRPLAPAEDPIRQRLSELPGLTLDDLGLVAKEHHWRLLSLPSIPFSHPWRKACYGLSRSDQEELWTLLLHTGQTVKCQWMWRRLHDMVHTPTCHDSDWQTLRAIYDMDPVPGEEGRLGPQLDLQDRRGIREDVLQGLSEMGYQDHHPVYELADYQRFNRELVYDLLRHGILRLTALDLPWWISPEGREYWQELDRLSPGWADSTVPLLSELVPATPDNSSRVSLEVSFCCPEARVGRHLRDWLSGQEDTWNGGSKDRGRLSRATVAYLLLCGRLEERDGRYLFLGPSTDDPDLSGYYSGQTAVTIGRWINGLKITRAMIEEYIVPLRESWNWVAHGKSARSVPAS